MPFRPLKALKDFHLSRSKDILESFFHRKCSSEQLQGGTSLEEVQT